MASEQAPAPASPSRRTPRGVADLPLRQTDTADLASFKPKRREAHGRADLLVGQNAPKHDQAVQQRGPASPSRAASLPLHEPGGAQVSNLREGAERERAGWTPALQFKGRNRGSLGIVDSLPAEGRGEGETPFTRHRNAPVSTRRLIVNADDFGRSQSINQAVIRAHREGILTTASLMVNGDAVDEAVELAKQNPALGVGLHLTLVCGKATCGRMEIPDLVNPLGEFSDSPVAAGTRYFFNRGLRLQLAREIAAQFARFKATGLTLDHVNGHLNLHLHPTVFELLASRYQEWGIRRIRITDDPYALNRRLARGQWFYRASHAFIFRRLSARARRILSRSEIRFTDHVFGLLQNARVDERYITRLLPELPRGDSELYSHPSLDEFRHEFDALVSPRVKALVAEQNIRLIRYQDL